jgi:T5SS/PEP-CTERM-associated repeat protein
VPIPLNARDRNQAPKVETTGAHTGYDRTSLGLSADAFRIVFLQNYVELPLVETVWIDGTGDWFNPSNWSAVVPNSSTIAQINNGGTAQITSGIATASQVELGIAVGDVGTLSTSGSGSLQDEGAMYIGEQGTGTLSITASTTVSSSLFVLGQNPGSNGTATVSGSGSTWTNLVFCFVGSDGTGTLNITNGGSYRLRYRSWRWRWFRDSSGRRAGSNWSHDGTILIGGNANGVGMLTISNGGTVFTGGGGGSFGSVIAYNPGSNGSVNVSGVGSTWTNLGPLAVSEGGDGTLHIMDAGTVSNSYGVLGSINGGRAP